MTLRYFSYLGGAQDVDIAKLSKEEILAQVSFAVF
jgi:hypothetical protein